VSDRSSVARGPAEAGPKICLAAGLRALVLLMAAATTVGCSTSPTESHPLSPLLTRLHVVISIVDSVPSGPIPSGSALFSVQAFLDKGRDANGQVRQVIHDSLRVLGWTLAPVPNSSNTELDYAGTFAYPRATIGTEPLSIIAPQVAGVTADFPILSWRTIRQAGPRDLHLLPAEDLLLDLGLPPTPAVPAFGTVRWSLDVITVTGAFQVLQLSGTGLPPAQFRVDRALLPQVAPGRLQAQLTFFVAREDNVLTMGPYVVTPVIQTTLTWNVSLQ
jgi:hypothetical protein